MLAAIQKQDLAKALQAKINAMQGFGKPAHESANPAFVPFSEAFPNAVFPTGVLHEFISYEPTETASTNGFIAALSGKLMKPDGLLLWVGNTQKIFASGLKHFGIEPDRIVFIHVVKAKEALWTIEEALKCEALTAVIGEIKELGFTESRRLQLAVERSGISGFIHRVNPASENPTAATTRWKIMPMSSVAVNNLPGIGYSSWDVQLIKVRNGKPNSWQITWSNQRFIPSAKAPEASNISKRHAG